jgi:hypothetical protein
MFLEHAMTHKLIFPQSHSIKNTVTFLTGCFSICNFGKSHLFIIDKCSNIVIPQQKYLNKYTLKVLFIYCSIHTHHKRFWRSLQELEGGMIRVINRIFLWSLVKRCNFRVWESFLQHVSRNYEPYVCRLTQKTGAISKNENCVYTKIHTSKPLNQGKMYGFKQCRQ